MSLSKLLSYRGINAFLFVMSIVATLFAVVYLQGYLKLEPCPLCIFQRIGLWIMGFFALVALILNPKRVGVRWVLWLGKALGVLWGAGVAARHVYLTYLPSSEVPACGPGLNYWMDTLPILQVFKEVLTGAGECAMIDWTFLGISLPEMTLMLFVFLAVVLVYLLKFLKVR